MHMKNFTFEIKRNIGVLSTSTKGWSKEVNLVSWNGAEPKLDIRDWSEDHQKMGKGLSLTPEEAKSLLQVLSAFCSEK